MKGKKLTPDRCEKNATEKLPTLLEIEAIETAYADLFIVFN